jgi:hypothetical protein
MDDERHKNMHVEWPSRRQMDQLQILELKLAKENESWS